jgi:DNA-directed RNA polymerase subunit RPC12/RpoP
MSHQEDTKYSENKDNSQDIKDKDDNLINKSQINKIRKILKCPLCRDILLEPVTLYCQHTFCNHCLESLEENSLVKCPTCNHKGLLVPAHNYKIKELIEKFFTKEELKDRQDKHKEKILSETSIREKEREKEIKRQIRKEVWYNEINKEKNNDMLSGNNFFLPLNL